MDYPLKYRFRLLATLNPYKPGWIVFQIFHNRNDGSWIFLNLGNDIATQTRSATPSDASLLTPSADVLTKPTSVSSFHLDIHNKGMGHKFASRELRNSLNGFH